MAAEAQYDKKGYHDEVATYESRLRSHAGLSFDKLRMNGLVSFPFVVSLSNHERISQHSLGSRFNTLRAIGLLGISTALRDRLLQVVH